jgi:hypothetical protein
MGSETDRRPKQGSRQVQKLDSKILDNSHDPDYKDIAETMDSRKSGAKILPLLLQVSKHCRAKASLSVDRARCIGSKGCHTSWTWPRYRQCILEHASKCGYIDGELRQGAEDELNKKAIGPPAIVPGWQSRPSMVEEEMVVTETTSMTQTIPTPSSAITPFVTDPH